MDGAAAHMNVDVAVNGTHPVQLPANGIRDQTLAGSVAVDQDLDSLMQRLGLIAVPLSRVGVSFCVV